MRREDEEFDEEDEAWRNKQYVAAMVCQPTEEQPQCGGSVAGRFYKPRNRAMTHANLMNNYFNPNSMYTEDDFRRRFRMRRHVFKRVLYDVHHVNPYFQQKLDRLYKEEYLRKPNQEYMDRLFHKAKDRGFPGIIGSLDCMHWNWKNYPIGWQ
ncbi:uncharacterized protein LOC103938651 [Pyrus x bretschneideri]|uniref:uncharacterized protein LOC103938651 n=1 Tax=Pyrus x bretschneideri TaxID=225117 RepID=UPI00202FFC40|nr:uncharacterized protein LOC103938651 [Pyrus x bretschneideri]